MVVENKIIGFYNNEHILCEPDKSIYVKIELLGRGKEEENNFFLSFHIYSNKK